MTKLPIGISFLLMLLMGGCLGNGAIGLVAVFYSDLSFGPWLIATAGCLVSCGIGWWLHEKLKDWA